LEKEREAETEGKKQKLGGQNNFGEGEKYYRRGDERFLKREKRETFENREGRSDLRNN